MKSSRFFRLAVPCVLVAAGVLCSELEAQPAQPRGRGLWGDWMVTTRFGEQEMRSVLSFSRSQESGWTGTWISFWGVSELKDVQLEDGRLSFAWERRNREGEAVTATFKGTVADGKLSGKLSGERGDTEVTGARRPRAPRGVGQWELHFKVGEREVTNTLAISADDEGNLAADWKSDRVEHTITDVAYERGTLRFKSASKMEDREWASTFEASIEGDTLSGKIQSERGEIPVEGKRLGAEAIGTWNLEVTLGDRTRKQRLRVYPDLSALFGATRVEKVEVADGKLSFKIVLRFGENEFEIGFQGAIDDTKLTGELTSSRGTQKVTGTKVPRRVRARRSA